MSRFRQLRWQLLAAQLVVVLVGVVVLAVTADVTREALLVAALAATLAGVVTSSLLLRQILRPLDDIARNSRRIAAGHYDERVTVPASAELATVATSFNQMASALAQVEEQRVALIGNVAHELRTPLTGMEGFLEGMLDGVFEPSPETLVQLQHEVHRMRRLVNDLQTLSNVEAGQVVFQLADVDLVALTQRVVARLRPQVLGGELELAVDAPVPLAPVWADPDRVAQILFNLVGNAVAYTPAGGRITVQLRSADGFAQAAVVDTGVGIAAADLPHLFERFYRVDRSRSRASGGSGIGLTVARHLAWAMGGDVTAESAGPGRGSTFTLRLPLAS